jgi:hypothetical protein
MSSEAAAVSCAGEGAHREPARGRQARSTEEANNSSDDEQRAEPADKPHLKRKGGRVVKGPNLSIDARLVQQARPACRGHAHGDHVSGHASWPRSKEHACGNQR